VLLGLQHDLARLFSQHLERLVAGHRQELGGGPGAGLFGFGDFTCLVRRDCAPFEGISDLIAVSKGVAGIHGGLGFAHRDTGGARQRGGVIELGGEHGLAVRGELLGPGIGGKLAAGRVRAQQLGLEVRVGLFEPRNRFVDGVDSHTHDCDRFL
jgi:hypothetical protein